MRPRVVLLTSSSWEGQALSQRLVDSGLEPVLIVREEPLLKFDYSLPSRLARGLLGDRIVNELAAFRRGSEVRRTLKWERTLQEASHAWLEAACQRIPLQPCWPGSVRQFRTHVLNDETTVERVREAKPDVMVVFSTSLLRTPLLAIPTYGTLNGHSSLLPNYRGARSEFWQCYNDDQRHLGITIHLVDPRIDSGPILFQLPTPSTWPTDPFHLRAMNTLSILEHYPQVIKDHLAGKIVPRAQGPSETKLYLKRDVTMEARVELKRRTVGP